jgi:hypothetical protein
MSGGGGGVIIIDATKATLSNPLVHGNLPEAWPPIIDPILAKDSASWTAKDKKQAAACYTWALTNLV